VSAGSPVSLFADGDGRAEKLSKRVDYSLNSPTFQARQFA